MRLLLVFSLASLAGCVNEHALTGLCGTPDLAFDITEASVLEDAQGYWGMHDAVILQYDLSRVPEGARWRVRDVDIMPMIGASEFSWYMDGQSVSVEVWDGDNPYETGWKVTQTFRKDDHEWDDTTLTNPSSAWELNQKYAWWTFDFTGTIPTSGMTGPDYLVGVVWEDDAYPTLGYSNFNRSCALNWTDYADGFGWVLNSDHGSGDECSWPMLRVTVEILEESEECDEYSVPIE